MIGLRCSLCIIGVVSAVYFHYRVLRSVLISCFFFFQAEDGIRDLVRSRGLGDVYKRQRQLPGFPAALPTSTSEIGTQTQPNQGLDLTNPDACLLYTSDAADERSSVDLGGRRIIKKKTI